MLVTSCRAYRKTSALFDTDHYMVKMTLKYPSTKKERKSCLRHVRPSKPKPKLDITSLRHNPNIAEQYSDELNKCIDSNSIPSDVESLTNTIVENIKHSLDAVCPKVVPVKSKEPWEDNELQALISQLRKASLKDAETLKKQIRQKRLQLKNEFYNIKAAEINSASEARQVEK